MSGHLAALLLAAAWYTAGIAVWADEAAPQEAAPFVDCDHPPTHAARAVPEPIARWAQLECTPAGQILVPSEDWAWRFPGSFTDRPFVPAWMSAAESVSAEPRFFRSIAARQAGAEEAQLLAQRFASSNINLPPHAGQQQIYILSAESNLGEKFEVNFVYRSDQDIWAVPCAPDCLSEQLFHIYRRE